MKKRRRKKMYAKRMHCLFFAEKFRPIKKNILNITINLNGNNVIIKLIDECKL